MSIIKSPFELRKDYLRSHERLNDLFGHNILSLGFSSTAHFLLYHFDHKRMY